MANPYRAEVEVTIGGKPRKLVFNANSIAAIEEKMGEGVFALAEKLGDGAGAPMTSILRVMLWAGLTEGAGGKKITLQNVGRAMRIDEYEQYATECMRGLLRAYGEDLDTIGEKAENVDPLGPGEDAKENPSETVEEELTSELSDDRPSLPASVPTSSGG